MEPQSTIAAPAAPPPEAGPERTAASGWVLRAVATAHLLAGFAQPVFAGVYLSGDFDGLSWHVIGADLVSYLGIAQLAAAVAVWIRVRRAWPLWASLALTLGALAQYFAGMEGALWLHFPLGVALVAGITAVFAAVWLRPLPRRKAVRLDG
jgi:hypothetical protein